MDKKHPFIWFTDSIEDGCDCSDAVLPVVLGSDLTFRVPAIDIEDIFYLTLAGKEIKKAEDFRSKVTNMFTQTWRVEFTDFWLNDDLREFLAIGDCFRLLAVGADGQILLKRTTYVYRL